MGLIGLLGGEELKLKCVCVSKVTGRGRRCSGWFLPEWAWKALGTQLETYGVATAFQSPHQVKMQITKITFLPHYQPEQSNHNRAASIVSESLHVLAIKGRVSSPSRS